MSNPATENASAKYKVWLIPILAMVLLGVIIYNNVGTSRPVPGCDTPAAPLPEHIVNPLATNIASSTTETAPVKTEVISLDKILPPVDLSVALKANPFNSHTPFASSHDEVEHFPQSALTSQAAESEGMVTPKTTPIELPPPATPPVLNVTGVFRQGGRVAAIINDRIIYPGEKVAEGWRLAAIEARGLVLEPDPR